MFSNILLLYFMSSLPGGNILFMPYKFIFYPPAEYTQSSVHSEICQYYQEHYAVIYQAV